MKLIFFSILGLAVVFSVDSFRLPAKESVQQKCMQKYAEQFKTVKRILEEELHACKSTPNEKVCANLATTKAAKVISEISEKIQHCIASEANLKIFDNSFDNVALNKKLTESECREIFQPKLEKIQEVLKAELEACETTEHVKECQNEAISKAYFAGYAVLEEIYKCAGLQ